MIDSLSKDDRLLLMKFVCSFAWADEEVQPEERALIAQLVSRFGLEADEVAQVEKWLESPPDDSDLDPADVPPEHRALFVDVAREIISADGILEPHELESLAIFKLLAR